MLQKNNLLRNLEQDLDSKRIPTQIDINGSSLFLRHCSAKLTMDDLVSWFVAQSHFPKMYFHNCHTEESQVVLGSLYSILAFPEITIHDNPYGLDPKLYGALGYSKNSCQSSVWQNFPNSLFVLPQVEIESADGLLWIHLWFVVPSPEMNCSPCPRDILSNLRDVPVTSADNWTSRATLRRDLPDRELWDRNVCSSVQHISTGKIDKVVLARQCSFTTQDLISMRAILAHLQKARHGLLFSVELCYGENFVGVTPEILYCKNNSDIEIMALAGTTSLEHSNYLFRSKEQSEFIIVKDFIYSKLKEMCKTISWTPDTVRQVSGLLHLCRNYRGTLQSTIHNTDIIRALHPTPAISGFPQAPSRDLITKIEPFHRGWYASPIGYVSRQKTQMYIAIRSALVRENKLHIFSGAGIVAGSIAEKEWEELDSKMAHFF